MTYEEAIEKILRELDLTLAFVNKHNDDGEKALASGKCDLANAEWKLASRDLNKAHGMAACLNVIDSSTSYTIELDDNHWWFIGFHAKHQEVAD